MEPSPGQAHGPSLRSSSTAGLRPPTATTLGVRALRTVKAWVGFTVTGHSNAAGSEDFNRALEVSRAQAVAAALVGEGVPAAWLEVRGQLEAGLPGLREPVVRLGAAPAAATAID